MTQEEKQLLIKDLSARLPYEIVALKTYKEGSKTMESTSLIETNDIDMLLGTVEDMEEAHYTIKPYLRPMSSMTEEEKRELKNKFCYGWDYKDEGIWDFFYHHKIYGADAELLIDWLNERHFDYRRLIPSGLAIEVTKENNPYK